MNRGFFASSRWALSIQGRFKVSVEKIESLSTELGQ
jgi:hypothetical protein